MALIGSAFLLTWRSPGSLLFCIVLFWVIFCLAADGHKVPTIQICNIDFLVGVLLVNRHTRPRQLKIEICIILIA